VGTATWHANTANGRTGRDPGTPSLARRARWLCAGELPRPLAAGHRLFVETLASFEAPPGGCAELSEISPAHAATLGAVIAGRKPGRTTDTEITVYKAMGIGMEDMIAANLAYRSALHAGTGQQLSW
jgi:alanine dehydrogenase